MRVEVLVSNHVLINYFSATSKIREVIPAQYKPLTVIAHYSTANMKAKFDYLFLGVLGLLIANAVIQSYLYGYLLSINNYFGFIAWVVAFTLRLGTSRYRRQAIGWLMILGTLNVLSFTLGRLGISIGNISEAGVEAVGLNPIILAISIAYYFANKETVNRILSNVFHGSKGEQEIERKKQLQFYLNKFSECDSQELDKLLKNFNDRPVEDNKVH